jgi:enoyl-CoA hydratase/carnithine racemase
MLELMLHCHGLLACHDSSVGFPEATLPVIPGMEGCHWGLRKADAAGRQRLLRMLLTGKSERSVDAVGWLVDFSGPLQDCVRTAWKLVSGGGGGINLRPLETQGFTVELEGSLPAAGNPGTEAARRAILDCVRASCAAPLSEALDIQSRHSGAFMSGPHCKAGLIGADAAKLLSV